MNPCNFTTVLLSKCGHLWQWGRGAESCDGAEGRSRWWELATYSLPLYINIDLKYWKVESVQPEPGFWIPVKQHPSSQMDSGLDSCVRRAERLKSAGSLRLHTKGQHRAWVKAQFGASGNTSSSGRTMPRVFTETAQRSRWMLVTRALTSACELLRGEVRARSLRLAEAGVLAEWIRPHCFQQLGPWGLTSFSMGLIDIFQVLKVQQTQQLLTQCQCMVIRLLLTLLVY